MKAFTVRLDNDLHARAQAKAERELRSLNAIIGRLLDKWVAGEVDLEPPAARPEGDTSSNK
ncbi:MAG: type II toxin-antitoxin system HicB family antitoxin [Chloroflexi bacterium]|nr:type II toxin-antitoxin system HicB family antitoxin [Chloroflexota bacterium]MBU1752021.1 type II toxin-antitoxin system HicB family antitoxin [Chloroflexota bacterium]